MTAVRCPTCAKVLSIRPEMAGKAARCPGCAKPFAVPRLASVAAGPADEPAEMVSELDVVEEVPPTPDEVPIEADVEEPANPAKPRKRRRRRKRADAGNPVLDEARYWLVAFGLFPWVTAGLCFVWLVLMVVGLLLPPVVVLAWVLAAGMASAGWVWIVLAAFRDDTFHGVLCVATPYWLIYPFLNLQEAWKPAILVALGVVMQVVSTGLFFLLMHHT